MEIKNIGVNPVYAPYKSTDQSDEYRGKKKRWELIYGVNHSLPSIDPTPDNTPRAPRGPYDRCLRLNAKI